MLLWTELFSWAKELTFSSLLQRLNISRVLGKRSIRQNRFESGDLKQLKPSWAAV